MALREITFEADVNPSVTGKQVEALLEEVFNGVHRLLGLSHLRLPSVQYERPAVSDGRFKLQIDVMNQMGTKENLDLALGWVKVALEGTPGLNNVIQS